MFGKLLFFVCRACFASCKKISMYQGKRACDDGARSRAGLGLFLLHLQGRLFVYECRQHYARHGG